jgi:hypothetical protein
MPKNEINISEGMITLSRKEAFVWPFEISEMAAVQISVLKSLELKKRDEWQQSYDSNISGMNETVVAAILTSQEEIQRLKRDDAHQFLKSTNNDIIVEWDLRRSCGDPISFEIPPKIANASLVLSTNTVLTLPIEITINFLGVTGPYSPQIGFIVGLLFVSFIITEARFHSPAEIHLKTS